MCVRRTSQLFEIEVPDDSTKVNTTLGGCRPDRFNGKGHSVRKRKEKKEINCEILIETGCINEITWIGVPVALTSEKLKADNKITQWRGECTWLPYLFWPAQHLTSCKRRIYRYIWKNKTMERTFAWYLSREYYWHLLQVGSCVCYPKRKLLWSFPQSGSVI